LLSEGSVSYLFFADRIMELPLGVFAIAVGTAVLPSMSRQTAANDMAGLKDTMSYAMRLVLFIAIPATTGLIALGLPIVNILFQHGQFTKEATEATAQALFYFCLGLPFWSALRVIVPTFYSMKDTLTPVLLAVAALATTIVCDVLFIGPLEYTKIAWLSALTERLNITGPLSHGGLALAASVGAAVNCIGLWIILKRRIGAFGGKKIAATFFRSTFASLVMGAGVWYLASRIDFTTSGFTTTKSVAIIGCVFVGMFLYGLLSYAIRSKELLSVINIVKGRLRKSG
jgi:putative peptidoglycan lipid II flippase